MKIKLTIISFVSFFLGFVLFKSYEPELYTMHDFVVEKIKTKKMKGFAKPDKPDKAMQWFVEQRAYPNQRIPDDWRENALQHVNKLNKSTSNPNALSWTQLGPGNVGGRIRAIAVHPTNPDIVYLGAVAGGVWKSTNGGNSWTSISDFMENIAVCALVIDPANPDIIYAGTGEGFFNFDAIRGAGIFKSTDAGNSWTRLASTNNSDFYYVNDLDIDKTNGRIYAATRKAFYYSANGGVTFNPLISAGTSDANCMDIEIAYTNPTTVYATFGQFNQAEIWRSTDGGATFTQNLTQASMGRIEMAVSQSNPLVAYASFMDLATRGTADVKVTTDGGNNWNSKLIPGPSFAGASTYTGAQGWYNSILAVDPENSDRLLAGGIDNWRSSNSGGNWGQTSNWYFSSGAPPYVHADQHAYVFAPSNPNIVYLGNDGGIYKSTDRGETWVSSNNNLFITQFYYGAVNPTGTVYLGGTQDNGTLRTTGSTDWYEILGGDGGATEVDYNNPLTIYMEYVDLAIFKSTDGGTTFFKAMNGIPRGSNLYDGTTDRTLFISPFSISPNNPNTLVAGTYRVWRTTNGANDWDPISGDLTGSGTGSSGATISTVVIAKGDARVIYAGCTNGRVQVTTNNGTSWNLRNTGLPNLYATRIAIKNNSPATAFVTFSGYTNGSKVYKTTDYGVSWTNISGNLPNIPVNCIFIHPDNENYLYIGTDLGVFATTNGGTNWVQEVNGMANVPVLDLDYRSSDNRLFAATHGRSMYSAVLPGITSVNEVSNELPNNFNLSQNYPNPFNPITTFRYSLPQSENVKVSIFNLNGELIAEVVNQFQSAGTYEVVWNGKNNSGQQVASGTYIYKVQAGNYSESKKMILLK